MPDILQNLVTAIKAGKRKDARAATEEALVELQTSFFMGN
jgi:uncharacterized protein YeaC (DUF1315 family)